MKLTKGKVIGALAILVILAAAFWYGGNAPGLQGWTVGVRESSPVLESIQPRPNTRGNEGKMAIARADGDGRGFGNEVVAVVVAVVSMMYGGFKTVLDLAAGTGALTDASKAQVEELGNDISNEAWSS